MGDKLIPIRRYKIKILELCYLHTMVLPTRALGLLARQAAQKRGFATSLVRADAQQGGMPGRNLPFNIYGNIPLFTLKWCLFWGSGFGLPYMIVRWHSTK